MYSRWRSDPNLYKYHPCIIIYQFYPNPWYFDDFRVAPVLELFTKQWHTVILTYHSGANADFGLFLDYNTRQVLSPSSSVNTAMLFRHSNYETLLATSRFLRLNIYDSANKIIHYAVFKLGGSTLGQYWFRKGSVVYSTWKIHDDDYNSGIEMFYEHGLDYFYIGRWASASQCAQDHDDTLLLVQCEAGSVCGYTALPSDYCKILYSPDFALREPSDSDPLNYLQTASKIELIV